MRTFNPAFRKTLTLIAAAAAVGALGACDTGDASTDQAAAPTPAATSTAPAAQSDAPAAKLCGQARGPEGALDVNILADSAPVECDAVMKIANQFGPKISMSAPGTPTAVDGWNCVLPSVPKMLARCDHDGQRFGMFIAY